MMGFARLLGTLGLATVVGLAGCSSTPKKETPASSSGSASSGAATAPSSGVDVGAGTAKPAARPAEIDPRNPPPDSILAKKVVYFDFDSAVVREEFTRVLEAHANYLADHPGQKIALEGHCDDRGTREYNLGLGERRAQAVQQFMTLMGAKANQIRTISYGEERPASMGTGEDVWRLNRRVEIVYQ